MGVTVGPGATIAGRYRLESPIGEGGFGAVFRATDLRSGQPVAVKVLLEGAVESGARFRREAELAMRLSHPNTVRTHDAGDDPVSGLYIVLELLEGGSLEQVLRAHGGFGPRRAAEIALAVLGSLREAHALGIVHRDIKPANVFLQRVPAGGVKVLDFGIAKSTNEGTRAGLTREGQTIGTPAYMAPEQVKGGELGPETDLYALGLVLAEAVSGKPVYATDSSLAVLVDKLNAVDPPLPAALAGTPLEAVVRRATRHNREDRYRSADEMRRAIEAAHGEMPATSSSVGRPSPSGPSAQQGREWGSESLPFSTPSSAPVAVATAETYGMDIPPTADTCGLDVPPPRLSSQGSTSAMAVLSSAPTAAQESLVGRPRLSSASEPPLNAPIGSQPVMSATAMSVPNTLAPTASVPRSSSMPGASTPSAPAFSTESQSSPYLSPFAPGPRLQPSPAKTSRLAVGCIIAVVVAFLVFTLGLGLVGYLVFHITGGVEPTKASGASPARAPSAPAKPGSTITAPVAPAARTAAVQFRCSALPQLDVMNINQKVNAAPGYRVQNQTMNIGAGSSVEITMTRNGDDAGRLVFIEGASPAALNTQEAARKADEPDAIYAVRGAKLLYLAMSVARARDLLPSLCGQGGRSP